jgi:hypothetical protein
MGASIYYACSMFLMSSPFLAIAAILAHYLLRRAAFRRAKRLRKRRFGYYPSAFALGLALQFVQVFYRPNVEYVLEAKQDDAAEEDDESDPETNAKELSRQLRRIRRGERVETLVLRL